MKKNIALLAITALSISACSFQRPTWTVPLAASPAAVDAALASDSHYPYFWDKPRQDIPEPKPPIHLRPCCAFGMDLQTKLGAVAIPFYQVSNIIEPAAFGPHTYDAGVLGEGTDQQVDHSENNGLLYSCRGGFLDTAHIRDNADWTLFLTARLYRQLGKAHSITLPAELGAREINIQGFDIAPLSHSQKLELAVTLAQWLSYQLSIWHEIGQWHGHGVMAAFPEYASAFSVEDLYSNILGTKIAAALIYGHAAASDQIYARSLDNYLKNTAQQLGAFNITDSRKVMAALDQHWWDSNQRLPEKYIVLKRNFNVGASQQPPIPMPELLPRNIIAEHCSDDQKPLSLTVKEQAFGHRMSELASLTITLDEEQAEHFLFPSEQQRASRIISDRDFQAIATLAAQQDKKEHPRQRRGN